MNKRSYEHQLAPGWNSVKVPPKMMNPFLAVFNGNLHLTKVSIQNRLTHFVDGEEC